MSSPMRPSASPAFLALGSLVLGVAGWFTLLYLTSGDKSAGALPPLTASSVFAFFAYFYARAVRLLKPDAGFAARAIVGVLGGAMLVLSLGLASGALYLSIDVVSFDGGTWTLAIFALIVGLIFALFAGTLGVRGVRGAIGHRVGSASPSGR